MLDIKVCKATGNLLIKADDLGAVQDVLKPREGGNYWTKWAELIEDYSCNGSYTFFDASEGNPSVGLSSAPCIAESMDYLDDGTLEIIGRWWHLQDYVTFDELAALAQGETIIFTLGKELK